MQQPKTIVRFYRVFSLDGDTLWVVSQISRRETPGWPDSPEHSQVAQTPTLSWAHSLTMQVFARFPFSSGSYLVCILAGLSLAGFLRFRWRPVDQPIVSYLPFRPNGRNANKHAFHVHTPLSLSCSLHLISSDRAKTSPAPTDHPWGTRGEEGSRDDGRSCRGRPCRTVPEPLSPALSLSAVRTAPPLSLSPVPREAILRKKKEPSSLETLNEHKGSGNETAAPKSLPLDCFLPSWKIYALK